MARKKRNTQHVSAQSTQATSDVADASAQMISRFLDDKITEKVVTGLARMEDHWQAEDFQIEEYSTDVLNAWPVEEALDQLCEIAPSLRKFIVPDEEAVLGGIDPRYVLGCLASRLFLAGLEAARHEECGAA